MPTGTVAVKQGQASPVSSLPSAESAIRCLTLPRAPAGTDLISRGYPAPETRRPLQFGTSSVRPIGEQIVGSGRVRTGVGLSPNARAYRRWGRP